MKCLVTAFIPVYNGERFLREAVDSILQQTYSNFELLIVNDGSTDETSSILCSYTDSRIRIIENKINKGIAYTRNLAIAEAKGKYLALLDCDDIAMETRLAMQVEFMESNLDVAMCGGHALAIGEKDGLIEVPVGRRKPSGLLMFYNPFVNSTLMFRLDSLKQVGFYYSGLCEDYELSIRINELFPIANLDKVLVRYRVHSESTSFVQKDKMQQGEKRVIEKIHAGLGLNYDEFMVSLHHELFFKRCLESKTATLRDYYELLSRLRNANDESSIYTKEIVSRHLFIAWYDQIRASKTQLALYYLFKSPLFEIKWLTFKMVRKTFKQFFVWPNKVP